MYKALKKYRHTLNTPEKILRLVASAIRSKRTHRLFRPLARLLYQASAVVLVLLVLAYTVGRLWLPLLAERKAEIAQYLSQRSAYHVEMEALEPYWEGLNPGLRISGFKVYAPDSGRLAIQLDEVRISLSWLRLISGRVAINSLVLVQPSLTFERLADGRLRISGLDTLDADPPSEQDAGFIQWLLQQNELAVEDGEMQWIDHMSNDAPLRLTLVNMSLRNAGKRHHLEFEAVFPRNLCNECLFVADVSGNPLAGEPWDGEVYLRAKGVNTRTLPAIVRERLPAGLEGRLTAQLWSEWQAARPVAARGRIEAAALQLPLSGTKPAAIKQVAADVKWSGSNDGGRWRLDMDHVSIGLSGKPWSAGKLRLEHRSGENQLRVQHLNLDDLTAFLGGLPDENVAPPWLRAVKPTGEIDDFALQLQGDPAAPTAYTLQAGIRVLNLQPYEKLPGVSGLSGRLSLDTTSGEFLLASEAFVLDIPKLLPVPMALRKASGRFTWQRTDTQWEIEGSGLDVLAEDGKLYGGFEARIPHAATLSPLLKLRLDFSNMNGAHAANYYPVMLPEVLRHWLSSAVVSGRVTSGHVIYSGAVREFPFRDGNGTFEVAAHVSNGEFEYLPGWPSIDHIEADLLFHGAGLSVTGTRGRIRGLDVGRVAVTVDDLHPPGGAQVAVVGQVSGPLDETLQVLYDSPSGKLTQYLPRGLRASGSGVLDLDIHVPVRTPHDTRWTGQYHFNQNNVQLPFKDIAVNDIRGDLGIGNLGIQEGDIQARVFGEDLRVDIATQPGGAATAPEVSLTARSKLSLAGLAPLLGGGLAPYFQGEVPWALTLRVAGKATQLALNADLQGLGTSLPPPLDKSVGTPLTLSLSTAGASPGPAIDSLELRLGDRAGGRFLFQRLTEGGWSFSKGRLSIGEGTLPPLSDGAGLHLSVRAPALDADRWWGVIRSVSSRGDSVAPGFVTRLSGDVGELKLFGRHFGPFGMDAAKGPQGWLGQLRGSAVSGNLLVSSAAGCEGAGCARAVGGPRTAIVLTLDQLVIPERAASDLATHDSIVVDPAGLPEVHLKSKSLKVAGHALGELEFAALPVAGGWKIQTLNLSHPLLQVEASGDWGQAHGGQTTQLQARLTTPDMGALLSDFGFTQEIAGGKAEFLSRWSWAAAPSDFSLARLDGSGSISITDGRLVQVKQGAGRLLGIIDARALSRYLALDFSTLFSKGFTFDSIKGAVTVEKGNAYTQDLAIKGASANIGIYGRVGLAARDLDLDIKVLPRFRGELAVTGLLLGTPVVGVAVLAAQEILKKPLAAGTRVDYTVKGGWDDPHMVKVVKQTPVKTDSEN